jgi:hypothetical protein
MVVDNETDNLAYKNRSYWSHCETPTTIFEIRIVVISLQPNQIFPLQSLLLKIPFIKKFDFSFLHSLPLIPHLNPSPLHNKAICTFYSHQKVKISEVLNKTKSSSRIQFSQTHIQIKKRGLTRFNPSHNNIHFLNDQFNRITRSLSKIKKDHEVIFDKKPFTCKTADKSKIKNFWTNYQKYIPNCHIKNQLVCLNKNSMLKRQTVKTTNCVKPHVEHK